MILAIVITVTCLLASACFSGFENGMLAIRRAKLNHAAEEGHGAAVLMQKFLNRPGLMLGTILLGNNLANVFSAIYFDELVQMTLGSAPVYSTIAALMLTFFVLIFGEISPKVWFRQAPMRRCTLLIYPMYGLYFVMLPLVRLLNAIAQFVERLVSGGGERRPEIGLMREEFRTFVRESGRAGSLDPDAAQLLDSALEYTGQTAAALMTPLDQARTMPSTLTLREAVRISEDLGTSRFPIVRPTDEDGRWIGLFSVYDAIFAVPPERWDEDTVADHFRPLITISKDAGIDSIFKRAHATRTPLLAVLGTDRTPVGIISVRDVLRPLFGNLEV